MDSNLGHNVYTQTEKEQMNYYFYTQQSIRVRDLYLQGNTQEIISEFGQFGWTLIERVSDNWSIERLSRLIEEQERETYLG